MNRTMLVVMACAAVVIAGVGWLGAAPISQDAAARDSEPNRLAIVWTSGDPDVAHRMTLMYGNAAKRQAWFDEVRLIIWGPSQRLLVGDKDIQDYVNKLREAGVIVEACQACADSYGIADDLRDLELDVKYMGEPLSRFLKDDQYSVVTF